MCPEEQTVTSQAEEYLEAIYRLENKEGYARTMDLARSLNVVPGSVTNTIENLERKGLVTHEPYKGVKLTDEGRKIASMILRRHRLAERLLTDFLHIDWSEVHDPACKLEHAFSAEIIKALETALGHPKSCPHGNPIPPVGGSFFEDETVALTELESKTCGVIVKITEEHPPILQRLSKLSLVPGQTVVVESKSGPNGPYTVSVGGKTCMVDHDVASIIYVKPEGDVKR
jgi:DtxR family Mn-dependent transcriptional regulator